MYDRTLNDAREKGFMREQKITSKSSNDEGRQKEKELSRDE